MKTAWNVLAGESFTFLEKQHEIELGKITLINIWNTMTEKQKLVCYYLVGEAIKDQEYEKLKSQHRYGLL